MMELRTLLHRLEAMRQRRELEGIYTDAHIIAAAIETINHYTRLAYCEVPPESSCGQEEKM